jgi:hypothetical protein
MARRLFTADIETDGLLDTCTKHWVTSYTELDQKFNEIGSQNLYDEDEIKEFFGNPDNILIMHNGLAFDGPAITKIFGFKVEAEIIDTLILSWYLYPKMQKHGLAYWGETLGIAKPEIDNWEDLSLEEYTHRCVEDVKIQTALWKQMFKHFMLLYGNAKACWAAIRHLNFKLKCAALQEDAKWKLDVPACEELFKSFTTRYEKAKADLEIHMPDVPVWEKKTRCKKPFKMDGSLSAHGKNWEALVKEHVPESDWPNGVAVDYNEEIKYIKSWKEPNAGSVIQLKSWLTDLGWIPESFKIDRNKDTGEVRKIPQVKDPDTEELCESIARLIPETPALEHLRTMSVIKHRLGICKGFLAAVDEDGFVYAAVQGLTNTIRFKHKICVNIPSLRKPYGKEIRGLLTARDDKHELCGSDMSSLEDRTKQHFMWKHDPEYVKEMQVPGFDPHLDMALAAGLVTPDDVKFYKEFDADSASPEAYKRHSKIAKVRHAGKGCNYAATYGAQGPTIARAAGVSEEMGELLHQAYWERNWSLVAIADECIVKNSRGMKWLWNPVAKLWIWLKAEKDKFSSLNQSTGTYAFDRWVYHIIEKRPQLTGQFHDEVILEIKKGNREKCTKLLKDAVAIVNDELKLDRELDCDVDFGHSYSEIH